MVRKLVLVVVAVLCAGILPGAAGAAERGPGAFAPGAPGAGDPYFPLDGNGGYDVARYLLDTGSQAGRSGCAASQVTHT